MYAQSAAILRYCGTLAQLYPTDAVRAQQVDEVIDVIIEFLAGLESLALQAAVASSTKDNDFEDEEEEDQLSKSRHQIAVLKYVNEKVPTLFRGLEKRLRHFGSGRWAVGDSLSIADLAVYAFMLSVVTGTFDHLTMRPLQAYGRVVAVFEAVRAHPKVVAWNRRMREAV